MAVIVMMESKEVGNIMRQFSVIRYGVGRVSGFV